MAKTLSELTVLYDDDLDGGSYSNSFTKASSNGYDQQYYFLADSLIGIVSAWQALGRLDDFTKAKTIIDKTMESLGTVTINSADYQVWDSPVSPLGNELWDSKYLRPVCYLLRLMHQSPVFKSGYITWFNDMVYFMEHDFWERYSVQGTNEQRLYATGPTDLSHRVRIAHDLYIITGKEKYKTFIDTAMFIGADYPKTLEGSYMTNQLIDITTPSGQPAYDLDNSFGSGYRVVDGSHVAGMTEQFMLMYEEGYPGVTYEMLLRLKNTYSEILWTTNDPTDAKLYFNGTGGNSSSTIYTGEQASLGRMNYEFQVKYEDYTTSNVLGYNSTLRFGLLMLGRKIYNDSRPIFPEIYTPEERRKRRYPKYIA